MNTDCTSLNQYIRAHYRMTLDAAKHVIIEGKMTEQEMLNWHIPALPSGGGSMQPYMAFSIPADEKDTMYDVLQRGEQWELNQMFGNTWRIESSLYKTTSVITVYRASIYPIIPGSYVTESRQYALMHRSYVNAPEYHIYGLVVPLKSLVWLGDPHEFIYEPTLDEWKEIARKRLLKFPEGLQKQILSCK